MLSAYIDESVGKNQRAMCIGGWLCADATWDVIEREWKQRIEYEQRISIKNGFPPISRFHAADCSSLLNEFDRSKGWNNERQKKFGVKLIEILGKKRKDTVVGFTAGVCMDRYQIAYRNRRVAEKNVYRFGLIRCGLLIGEAMRELWPSERITIFYDHGPFQDAASDAWTALKAIDCPYRNFFETIAPRSWESCIALQPADLVAYEGQKTTDLAIRTGVQNIQDRVRKSLQALLGTRVRLTGHYFEDFFEAIVNWRKTGKMSA